MMIPIELGKALRKAEASIDADGELRAAHRKEIHLLMERLSKREHAEAGYFRRAKLAIACAHSSLKFLKAHDEVLRLARDTLEKSVLALQGQFALNELESQNGALHTAATNLTHRDEPD